MCWPPLAPKASLLPLPPTAWIWPANPPESTPLPPPPKDWNKLKIRFCKNCENVGYTEQNGLLYQVIYNCDCTLL